ncbi:molecular chaperone Hsp90 [Anaerovorax odorimutans]|uniref:Molecular chaperone Hsp90 n=1 Tax=Anaerovorax odorimutans TaxID=109327 RepID=A0ABT1RP62_9FIRM|nr:molecular chaperone Hsp90 [Anaerovorax odorimutans]MCQ4636982.1 molecular chaperone Hsp90 [Anaerovorax odorimutans]
MDKKTLDYVVEKTHELIDAQTCSSETRAAAQAWLDAVGTEQEAVETKKYIEELEADIMPIDTLIGFAESDAGAQVFGADKAKDVAAHAKEIKAAGAEFCDCPACVAVAAILEKKDSIL